MNALSLHPFPDSEYDAWLKSETERRLRWQFLPLYDDPRTAEEKAAAAVASMAPHTGATELRRVLDGNNQAGWVWLTLPQDSTDDLLLLDADSSVPAEALLELLIEHAGSAKHLLVDRMGGAATPTAVSTAAAMVPTATNMALQLTGTPPKSEIQLKPMTRETFEAWKSQNILDYAAEVEASTTADHESAMQESLESFSELLPDGLSTANQFLFDLLDPSQRRVGMLWISRRSPSACFIYDVVIDHDSRRRGLGRAAMNAAANWARRQGSNVLALNVYGQNLAARTLYVSLGYEIVVEEMMLELKRPAASTEQLTPRKI